MPKCPYCGSEDLTPIKSWRFRFYDVTQYKCNKCGGKFNHYINTTGRGKPEYDIKIKPKPTRKVSSATPSFDHETVKGWLVEIGELLGYYVETEFRIRSDIHRFDVAWLLWKDDEVPIAVFEVVVGGDVDKAIQRLVYAQHERVKGLFLVVVDRGDEKRARRVLKDTYPWLKVEIWYVDKVKELRDTLSKYEDEIRKLTTLGRQV